MSSKVAEEYGFEPNLYFNLETIGAWGKIHEILELASGSGAIEGVTFGRGDFAESMGLRRSEVDSDVVGQHVLEACDLTVKAGLKFCVGGSISAHSVPVLRQLSKIGAHAFESRKVSWFFKDIPENDQDFGAMLEAGLAFELAWLESKRERYLRMAEEDNPRRAALRSRFS
jgi:hypothetical protein